MNSIFVIIMLFAQLFDKFTSFEISFAQFFEIKLVCVFDVVTVSEQGLSMQSQHNEVIGVLAHLSDFLSYVVDQVWLFEIVNHALAV